MGINDQQVGHRKPVAQASEMTASHLADDYLQDWAESQGVGSTVELCYRILGLNSDIYALGNLAETLLDPTATELLNHWAGYPVIDALVDLCRLMKSDLEPYDRYLEAVSGNAAKLKQSFPYYSQRSFLITSITHFLQYKDKWADHKWRLWFRIWLIVEAAQRAVDFQCVADADIGTCARFTVNDYDSPHHRQLDQLLLSADQLMGNRPPTLDLFKGVLKWASASIINNSGGDLEFKKLLNALSRITLGNVTPLQDNHSNSLPHIDYKFVSPLKENSEMLDAPQGFQFELYPSSSNEKSLEATEEESEENSDCQRLGVDPTDTISQQLLKGNAIQLWTSEEFSFLPWSWFKPFPSEIPLVMSWMENTLSSPDHTDRLGAALCWLSVHLSQTLYYIQRLEIRDHPTNEWVITPDGEFAVRTAYRREVAWKPNESTRHLIRRPVDIFSIRIDPRVQQILLNGCGQFVEQPHQLDELWTSPELLEKWFRRMAAHHFPRIEVSMLAKIQGQHCYEFTHDHQLARWIASSTRAVTTGAQSYASWRIEQIQAGHLATIESREGYAPEDNLIGSQMVIDKIYLQNWIQEALKTIIIEEDDNVIRYHNSLAQYCVTVLYAATGSRPQEDPFDLFSHFNLDIGCVYVNEKIDESGRSSRLVPLPKMAVDITRFYIAHLQRLSTFLNDSAPRLAEAIDQLPKANNNMFLPLFFLLDDQLRWHSMNSADLPGVPIRECPFPHNKFRHAYSQRSSDAGVPREMIDGLMGHRENRVAPYGDYSPRCWMSDVNTHSGLISEIFQSYGFSVPQMPDVLPPLDDHVDAETVDDWLISHKGRFGHSLRASRRRDAVRRAIREADADIDAFETNKPLSERQQHELDEFANRLLRRNGTTLLPNASIRERRLLKRLNVTQRQDGSRPRISKRILIESVEHSQVTSLAPRALSLEPDIRRWIQKILKIPNREISKERALVLGTLLICLENRITYRPLLKDLLDKRNSRIIQSRGYTFLEYSEELPTDNYQAPVRRYLIGAKTAALIDKGLSNENKKLIDPGASPSKLLTQIPPPPAGLRDYLPDLNTSSISSVINALRDLVEQSNLFLFPGIVAAIWAGRVMTTSAPIYDYLRLTEGQRYLFPGTDLQEDDCDFDGQSLYQKRRGTKLTHQSNAGRFTKELWECLKHYTRPQRRVIADQINGICERYQRDISPCLALFGGWCAHLVRRGQKGKGYKVTTLQRYFIELRVVMEELGYQANLLSMDGDEVTHFYQQLLDWGRSKRKDFDYFAKRLQDFHRYADSVGVAAPDWDELDLPSGSLNVRPGLISQDEYLACLNSLEPEWQNADDQALFAGFILLLAFRFGLRLGEALHLRRCDWCENPDYTWVLVQPYRGWSLKTPSSRRPVPLMFTLHEIEQRLVELVLNRYESRAGMDATRPLVSELLPGQKLGLSSWAPDLSRRLIALIRDVTGSDGLVLHHCRHAFANICATALFRIESPMAMQLTHHIDLERVRQIALGSDTSVSLRSSMALARLMGHSHPQTALTSYCHLLTEWGDSLNPIITNNRIIKGALNTRSLGTKPTCRSSAQVHVSPLQLQPAPVNVFRMLRFVSLGAHFSRAAQKAEKLHPQDVRLSMCFIRDASKDMRFKSLEDTLSMVKGHQSRWILLKKINDAGWRRLLSKVEALDENVIANFMITPQLLQDIPYLVSQNQQILISDDIHAEFISQLFEAFNVRPANIRWISIGVDKKVETIMSPWLTQENSGGYRADSFPIIVNNSRDYRRNYLSIRLIRTPEIDHLHNGLELSIAVLGMGLYFRLINEHYS